MHKEQNENPKDALISVIIPVYNVKAYLARCVNSVMTQTYPHLEIFLVDDGSTDGSGELCDSLASGDERIRVIHRENGGAAAARNAGLDAAQGTYIAFADADDFLRPEMLERMCCVREETDADLVVGGFVRVQQDAEVKDVFSEHPLKEEEAVCIEGADILKQLTERDTETVVLWNKLYRREVFADVRFPEGRTFEDFYAAHRVLWNCQRVVYMKSVLYFYAERTDSVSRAMSRGKILDSVEGHEERVRFFREKAPELNGMAEDAMQENMKWRFSELAAQGAKDDCLWFAALCKEKADQLNIAYSDPEMKDMLESPRKYYGKLRVKMKIKRMLLLRTST